jgi:hypothetical protein
MKPGRARFLPYSILPVFCLIAWTTPGETAEYTGKPEVGAYCPLPKKGEAPVCLSPAKAEYGEFFAALESGNLSDANTAPIETDLRAGDATDRRVLALSSVSYGYYTLARQISEQDEADPRLLARLRHWNQLLLDTYGQSGVDPQLQAAVREAAVDLHAHAPAVGEMCPAGEPGTQCDGADGLVRALAMIDSNAGVRTPLSRLVNRLLGEPETGHALSGAGDPE